MLVAPKVGIASVMRSEASSRLSRWARNFWMRRRGANNRNQKAPTRAETKTREGSGRKSAQKGPIWLRIGNVRFAETGWWRLSGTNWRTRLKPGRSRFSEGFDNREKQGARFHGN